MIPESGLGAEGVSGDGVTPESGLGADGGRGPDPVQSAGVPVASTTSPVNKAIARLLEVLWMQATCPC